MNDAPEEVADLEPPLDRGEWAGWSVWSGRQPFVEHVGPFYTRRAADGNMECGCVARPEMLNGQGVVHGGALMAFADHAIFQIAYDQLRGLQGLTVSLNSEFLAPASANARLIGRGEVLKAGRNLIFIQGLLKADDVPTLGFSGVVKVLRHHH